MSKGWPLDPREVKPVREKEINYLWDMEVHEYSTEAEARARTGRKQVGLKLIDTIKGSAEAPRYRSRLFCTEVRRKGRSRTDLFGNTSVANSASPDQCCLSGRGVSS